MRCVGVIVAAAITGCGYPRPAAGVADAELADGGDAHLVDSVGPTTIHVTLSDRPSAPATFQFLAAYQDGSASWQVAPAPIGDTYEFTVESASYGFAFACIAPGSTGNFVNIAEFTAIERPSVTLPVPARCTDPVTVPLSGAIANANTTGSYIVSAGSAAISVAPGANVTYTLDVLPGPHDVVLVHSTTGPGQIPNIVAADVKRGVAVTAATTLNLDASSAMSIATTPIQNPPAGIVTISELITANGTIADVGVSTTGPVYFSLGSGVGTITDQYADECEGLGAGGNRDQIQYAAGPSTSCTLPVTLAGANVSVATAVPYPELLITWPPYDQAVGYTVEAGQQVGTVPIIWQFTVGAQFAGTMPRIQMPDLSAIPGWTIALQLQSGTEVDGQVAALMSSAGANDFPQSLVALAGTTRASAQQSFAITP